MGRGNCCVTGPYEGLYYIDNDYLNLYHPTGDLYWETSDSRLGSDIDYSDLQNWELDELATDWWTEEVWKTFTNDFRMLYPSFEACRERLDHGEKHAILENKLFYIALEDNEWSTAVELIQKEGPWPEDYSGLQKQHYQKYLDGIRNALFQQFEELGTYAGAWTSGRITK